MLINGVDIESLGRTYAYDGNQNMVYEELQVSNGEGAVHTYRKTYTWTNGLLTSVTGWEKQ